MNSRPFDNYCTGLQILLEVNFNPLIVKISLLRMKHYEFLLKFKTNNKALMWKLFLETKNIIQLNKLFPCLLRIIKVMWDPNKNYPVIQSNNQLNKHNKDYSLLQYPSKLLLLNHKREKNIISIKKLALFLFLWLYPDMQYFFSSKLVA